ncbi:MAG: hypothetical protein CMP12_21230 [Zunongwangia sp.]|uniref:Uncharacterized protein n=2 Tax=Zunongwangia profunda TaxID=398743 RepID=D5BF92_ZUNPS|nr:hypothetical protein [Zunongwangia profunda]ADF52990.1 hypothetical protein ZPR_2668 [Zunongwangia profunda SM-A87]MAO38382.1 hypothetical protein [Zunongwangia sp.]MAS70877.1 hypothetical protein [Zunongwangia sp.]HCV79688.1 hypothetical protein [Zunongwangia profunda]|tara:strand:- start:4264 stop:4575 length:312 start_codon:yes stop_codon:yes gene_type:complete
MRPEIFFPFIGVFILLLGLVCNVIDIKNYIKSYQNKSISKEDPPEPDRRLIENDIKFKYLKDELVNRVLRNNSIYMATESKTAYSDQLLNEIFFLNQLLKKYK